MLLTAFAHVSAYQVESVGSCTGPYYHSQQSHHRYDTQGDMTVMSTSVPSMSMEYRYSSEDRPVLSVSANLLAAIAALVE